MFFPIKDYNPTRKTSYITITFILINVVVFIYQAMISDLNLNVSKNAMIPWEITHMKTIENPVGIEVQDQHGYTQRKLIYREISPFLTLFTSMFMHGSFFHLFGNMLFLWIFGNNIEDYLGKIKFILFFLLTGLGASLVHIIFHPNSMIPVIGASGAVSGVMGAYLILFPTARVRTLVFVFIFITFVDIPAFIFLIVWFIFQFLYAGGEGVAWLAHIGGFLIGLFLIKWWRQKKPKVELIE
ncbi:MAG: rhomboid family intramembrane serine protease [Candidatus Aminicenantes bacterium]|nr:rhomboid family intramembrane serine protease [Candidatus Aminicenantes bacterium]